LLRLFSKHYAINDSLFGIIVHSRPTGYFINGAIATDATLCCFINLADIDAR